MQVSKGFFNSKDGTIAFRKHEKILCQKEAVEKLLTLPSTTRDIGELLSSAHAQEKAANRHCLLKVISSLQFLGRQGYAIRGHGDKIDGNFHQLMKLQGDDDQRWELLSIVIRPYKRFNIT